MTALKLMSFIGMKNSLTLTIEDNSWTVILNEKSYKIRPISTRFLAVIKAIEDHYPDYKIFIDEDAFDNPWITRNLHAAQKWGVHPVYEDIDKMLLHPEEKTCSLCEGSAWYNCSVVNYQCINCRAIESFLDKARFFKKKRKR